MSGRVRVAAVLIPLMLAGCGNDDAAIRASGTIEMDEIDVASLVGGRVRRLTVGEGDAVRLGDTLVVLERGEVLAQFRAQQAQAERADAQALEARRGARQDQVRAARADVAAAQAQLDLAQRDFTRAEELAQGQVIAQADLDRARSARDAARARHAAAAANMRLLEAGNRREQVVAAAEAAEAARASAQAMQSQVGELVLTAPVDGVVLLANFQLGELAQPGQAVLTLGNPDSLWMRVYVPATEIDRVAIGARADVRLTGVDRTFGGRVVEIATRSEFTPRVALTEEERSNIVFAVKIVLDPSRRALKPGLPADVVIHAPRRASRA